MLWTLAAIMAVSFAHAQVEESDCTLGPPTEGLPGLSQKLKNYALKKEPDSHSVTESGVLRPGVEVTLDRNACVHAGRGIEIRFLSDSKSATDHKYWMTQTAEVLDALGIHDLARYLRSRVKLGKPPELYHRTEDEFEQVSEYQVEKAGKGTRVVFNVYSTP